MIRFIRLNFSFSFPTLKDTGRRNMPRIRRAIDTKGYVHLIERGISQQIIFEDEQDYQYYLKLLRKYSDELDIKINAYCLMDNHVHLLVYYEDKSVSLFMKKIGISYSNYYNKKYSRTGHLFQDRFKSEQVFNDRYYLTVLRYILNNPVKAGISSISEYRWSSYHLSQKQNEFVDASLAIQLCGGFEKYYHFLESVNDDECMEYNSRPHDDTWARNVMLSTLEISSGNDLKLYDKIARDSALRKLNECGLSYNQISRLTGLGKSIVQRACQ